MNRSHTSPQTFRHGDLFRSAGCGAAAGMRRRQEVLRQNPFNRILLFFINSRESGSRQATRGAVRVAAPIFDHPFTGHRTAGADPRCGKFGKGLHAAAAVRTWTEVRTAFPRILQKPIHRQVRFRFTVKATFEGCSRPPARGGRGIRFFVFGCDNRFELSEKVASWILHGIAPIFHNPDFLAHSSSNPTMKEQCNQKKRVGARRLITSRSLLSSLQLCLDGHRKVSIIEGRECGPEPSALSIMPAFRGESSRMDFAKSHSLLARRRNPRTRAGAGGPITSGSLFLIPKISRFHVAEHDKHCYPGRFCRADGTDAPRPIFAFRPERSAEATGLPLLHQAQQRTTTIPGGPTPPPGSVSTAICPCTSLLARRLPVCPVAAALSRRGTSGSARRRGAHFIFGPPCEAVELQAAASREDFSVPPSNLACHVCV